ncbi:HbrB-domain-containing protein [Ceratobasidium sp. AG-I]|nr:HbrB-domain-containing protein [Ceratobasidium sp. AG-I]
MLKSRRDLPPISNPRPTSPLPPRRSHDSRSDSPAPFLDAERRRSNSDGTAPTPRPPPRPLAAHVPSPVQEKGSIPGSSSSSDPRLRQSPVQQRSGNSASSGSSLFVTHSLGMSRSQGGTSRDVAGTTIASSAASINTARTSPVKGRAAYDSKLMAREMDRLGLSAHSSTAPSANVSTLSLPLSNPTLPNIAAATSSSLAAATHDTAPYQQLHVHVLPLFNSENLKVPIEDLNNLVKQHIQVVISRAPSRALTALEQDVKELVNTGMMTLNAKLAGLEEETLLTRVVQIWGFFWEQVLPYLEGVFLPLQTEKILQNLSRPKPMRTSSPGSPTHDVPGVVPLVGCLTVDVRNVVLQSFRDSIIVPIWQKLYDQFVSMGKEAETNSNALGDRYTRLQQMLLVLSSASPRSISLAEPTPPASPSEAVITHLLHAILRVRALAHSGGAQAHQRFPPPPVLGFGGAVASKSAAGMLFGAAPRDRRGRIAHRDFSHRDANVFDEDGETDVFAPSRDESELKSERQREREFFESLKSPMVQNDEGTFEGKTPQGRTVEQPDTRGLGFATAMRAVI